MPILAPREIPEVGSRNGRLEAPGVGVVMFTFVAEKSVPESESVAPGDGRCWQPALSAIKTGVEVR